MSNKSAALAAIIVALAFGATMDAAAPTSRPADAILEEIQAIDHAVPASTQGATAAPADARAERKATLVRELAAADPESPQAVEYLAKRWHNMQLAGSKNLEAELDAAIQNTRSDGVVTNAYLAKFNIAVFAARNKAGAYATLRPIADAYAARLPDGEYLGDMYLVVADNAPDDNTEEALLRKGLALTKAPPQSAQIERASGRLKSLEASGKPLTLEFDDVVSGKKIRVQDLHGKVVVLDFWATWCAPCKAAMPAMKKLYAEYKDKGVEFIGVSLDGGDAEPDGLARVKAYVTQNDITWPQYYQGKSWDADFSSSLGVIGIPKVMVLDKKGIVVSIDATGSLDTLLPTMLATGAANPVKN